MKDFKQTILVSVLMLVIASFLPVFGNDELDNQCKEECKNSGFEDGHYKAPEPGSECNEGFSPHSTDQICCCK